jgi:hypothetical protein
MRIPKWVYFFSNPFEISMAEVNSLKRKTYSLGKTNDFFGEC